MGSTAIDFAEVERPRLRRAPTSISTRFDLDTNHRPLYSRQNEFEGGPSIGPGIFVDEGTGKRRPLEQCDYEGKRLATPETRDSEDVSSVHKVRDLGFGAAADGFPNSLYGFSDSDSLKREVLSALAIHHEGQLASGPERATSSTSVESKLREKVGEGLDWSSFDEKEYLPLDTFEQIFDVRSMISLLAERYPSETNEELWFRFTAIFDPSTQTSRRRILGILVLMKGFVLIQDFIQENIWDNDLPFKYPGRDSKIPKVMKNWDRNERELFFKYQQMLFVPFFNIQDERLLSYDLDRDIRLPWQKFEYKTSGGTGVVHRVEIHPSHHSFRGPGIVKPVFALKEIDAVDQKVYNEELSALEKTCAKVQKEKHLIKLLLTFRHGEKFYLLFEWADGNLENFWESDAIKPRTSLAEKWAAEQCLGLARAVQRIHSLSTWQKKKRSFPTGAVYDEPEWGRHGDIKPDNILWFKDHEGDHNLLVISDLGLTRYHTQVSRSLVRRSQIDGCTRAYRPPELDMGSAISQKYDIWSLGCVFLEFCIWYLQGYDEVQSFAVERMLDDKSTIDNMVEDKFFLMNGGLAERRTSELKPSVKERIAALRDKSISTEFTEGLLDVIENKMLLCDPCRRAQIDEICMDLTEVRKVLPHTTIAEAEEISQTGAFAGGGSLIYPPSLSEISQDETSNWTLESPGASTKGGQDAAIAVSTRSGASRQEDMEHDNHHNETVSSKGCPGALEIIEPNIATIAAISPRPPTASSETTAPPEQRAQQEQTPQREQSEKIAQPEMAVLPDSSQRIAADKKGQIVWDQQSPRTKTKRHLRNKSSQLIRNAFASMRFWKK